MRKIMNAAWVIGLASFILAIWTQEFRWQYILTGVLLLVVSLVIAGIRSQQTGIRK